MSPPTYGGTGAVPLGAVKAGTGIEILPDGTINASSGGGTVTSIVAGTGLQGGGPGPQVFLSLLPPAGTAIGGVRTIPGSGLSIDSNGVIRAAVTDVQLIGANGITVTPTSASSAVISLNTAGNSPSRLGGVYTQNNTGIGIATDGEIYLSPATAGTLGGIRPGVGCSVTNGVLNIKIGRAHV